MMIAIPSASVSVANMDVVVCAAVNSVTAHRMTVDWYQVAGSGLSDPFGKGATYASLFQPSKPNLMASILSALLMWLCVVHRYLLLADWFVGSFVEVFKTILKSVGTGTAPCPELAALWGMGFLGHVAF